MSHIFDGEEKTGELEMSKTSYGSASRGPLRPALLGLLLVCVGFTGCASQKDVTLLQKQIWAVHRDLDNNKSRIARTEKAVNKQLKEARDRYEADSQPLRRNQAEVGVQLDRIELELGRLQGQLEEAGIVSSQYGQRISELQESQMTSMLELQKAVDDLERRLNRIAVYLGLEELAVRAAEQTETEKTAAAAEQPTPTAAAIPEKPSIPGPEELYGEAFRQFRAGQFQLARKGFTTYLENYPNTDLADNAQFWLAECYYGEKRYREAIAAYEKAIKTYPKSDKLSSVYLKQGMAFMELGDKTAARILFKKVIKGYPDSNQAKIAESKLASIK
jgi:tol-pal system protein YbgF